MYKPIDLVGKTFGSLMVICRDDKKSFENGASYWVCKCECGKTIIANNSRLKSGNTKSCGLCYTFEDWCLDNNHQDYLDLWDYELNDKKPNEIGYGSGRKIYFKCSNGLHESEQFIIFNLINPKKISDKSGYRLKCKKCNSIGFYLHENGMECMWADNRDMFKIAKFNSGNVYLKCPDCGTIKKIKCSNFVKNGLGCPCGDGISYPNKFLNAILSQLQHVAFRTEETICFKRFDAIIPKSNIVIEMHGAQHYNHINGWGVTLEDQMSNDQYKKQLATDNKLKYIEIDCRKSDMEWIKQSIMNSELPKILNFKEEDIDWTECDRSSLGNKVKEVCQMWENTNNKSTGEIAKRIKLSKGTVVRYLKRGAVVGWCNYDSAYELEKTNAKQVEMFKDDISLGVFKSAVEIDRVSKDMFGVKLTNSIISKVCRGEIKIHKGYTFKYFNNN